jgi:hypothetical protein
MKKLLSILGAIGIVASSSTAVASCGAKPKGNDDTVATEELTSTKELTSMMLLQKSENYGDNITDILSPDGETSPGMLGRFANATQYDADAYGEKKSESYLQWTNMFSSQNDDNNEIKSGSNVADFISKNSLSTITQDDSNKLNISDSENKLDYLLSDSVLATANDLSSESLAINTPVNGVDNADTFAAEINNNVNAYASGAASGATGLLLNPTADKIQEFINIVSNEFPVSFTASGATSPTDPSKGVGGLLQLWIGGTATATADVMGDKVGLISEVYEQMWLCMMQNQDTYKDLLGDDIFHYLVGTDDTATNLIADLGSEGEVVTAYKNTVAGKTDTPENASEVFFKSEDNRGLYGEIINKIGNLKYHNSSAKDFDALTGEGTMGHYNHNNFMGIDSDVLEVLELTSKLFHVTSSIFQENVDAWGPMETIFASKFGFLLKMGLGMLGLPALDYENHFADIMEYIVNILDAFLGYKNTTVITKDTPVADFTDIFSNAYSEETAKALVDALSLMADSTEKDAGKDGNWFSDINADYRIAVASALGVEADGTVRSESMFGEMVKLSKIDKYRSLFLGAEGTSAIDYLINTFDKNILDDKTWTTKNEAISYTKDNTVDQVQFDLYYDGLGNENVTEFKAGIGELAGKYDLQNMSEDEVLNKLNKTSPDYDEAFANAYNGSGLKSDMSEVKHKYHVVWKNESTSMTMTDLKLQSISSVQAYINNSWVDMSN